MSRRFAIDVNGHRAIAELLDEAPTVANKFWESLPLTSFAIHAKFAGGEIIVMLPFYADCEHEVLEVQKGDIGYFPDMQTLCLFYGDVTPFGYVSVFARVVEGLDEMVVAGRSLLEDVSATVRLAPVPGRLGG